MSRPVGVQADDLAAAGAVVQDGIAAGCQIDVSQFPQGHDQPGGVFEQERADLLGFAAVGRVQDAH